MNLMKLLTALSSGEMTMEQGMQEFFMPDMILNGEKTIMIRIFPKEGMSEEQLKKSENWNVEFEKYKKDFKEFVKEMSDKVAEQDEMFAKLSVENYNNKLKGDLYRDNSEYISRLENELGDLKIKFSKVEKFLVPVKKSSKKVVPSKRKK